MSLLYQASEAHHIDGVFTTLNLIGGNDCSLDFQQIVPDLRVRGGAEIDKTLCVTDIFLSGGFLGNVFMPSPFVYEGNLLGNLVGDTIIEGCLTLNGNIKSNVIIDGNVTIKGDLEVLGNTTQTQTVDTLNANVAIGFETLQNTITNPGLSQKNVCIGYRILKGSNNAGYENVAIGSRMMPNSGARARRCILIGSLIGYYTNNDIGREHIMIGRSVMYKQGSGNAQSSSTQTNIGIGTQVFYNGTRFLNSGRSGSNNIAIGTNASSGYYGVAQTAIRKIAIGWQAGIYMDSNYALCVGNETGAGTLNTVGAITTAPGTTAIGHQAFRNVSNSPAEYNTAVGFKALRGRSTYGPSVDFDITGSRNVAVGAAALANVSSGFNSTAMGFQAGMTLRTGSNCVLVGSYADVDSISAVNRIAIGSSAVALSDGDVQIGSDAVFNGSAVMNFRTQNIADESWIDAGVKVAGINATGDIFKTSFNVSELINEGNVTAFALSGTRTGAGNINLTIDGGGGKPRVPTDTHWCLTFDIAGIETGISSNLYCEKQFVSAFNNSGNVTTTKLSEISKFSIGSLAGDEAFVEGNTTDIDVIITTASTGTTKWAATMIITAVC